jgi:bifunctional DNase/RNase
MREVEVVGLRVEMPSNVPVLLLRENSGKRRVMSIYVGGPEASAIHSALEGVTPPRPLTHDVTVDLLAAVGARIVRVVVTEVRDQTYYAEIVLRDEGGERTVSARPSDGVALALRAGAGVWVADDLMDEVGREVAEDADSDEDDETVVDEFRDFLDTISPEDFSDPTS